KRIMPKHQVVRVESQHGKLLGIKIMTTFNFLLQIVAGSSQPFTGINVRLAVFEVGSHLRMNNLRLVHKERLCEESLSALIVPPQIMLGKSQCYDDRYRCSKESVFSSEISFSSQYQPDYGHYYEERCEYETWLQQSKEESVCRN